jgi:hypothetical protein
MLPMVNKRLQVIERVDIQQVARDRSAVSLPSRGGLHLDDYTIIM